MPLADLLCRRHLSILQTHVVYAAVAEFPPKDGSAPWAEVYLPAYAYAEMAQLVDALALGASPRKGLGVRVSLSA